MTLRKALYSLLAALAFHAGSAVAGSANAPFTLGSGHVVRMTRADAAYAADTGKPMVGLVYRSDFKMPQSQADVDRVEKELDADTQEICDRYAQHAIDTVRAVFPGVPFDEVGIVLETVTGHQGDTELTEQWTGIFHLTGNKCGARVKDKPAK